MKAASLVITAVFTVLLELQNGFASPCTGQKSLPARTCGEDDYKYYKRVFVVEGYSECNIKRLYENVFYQYKGENEEAFVKRIDFIFGSIYNNLDCRFDVNRRDYLKKYYEYKFSKKSWESDEQFFERVLTKTECETVYKRKVELIKTFVSSVDWNKVRIEEKTTKGFTIINQIVGKSTGSCGSKKAEKKIKKKSSKKKSCGKNKKSKKGHKKNVKKAEQKKACHAANVKKIEAQKAYHNENVKKIEGQKAYHNENVKKIEAQKQYHNENVKKIEGQKQYHNENVKKIEAQKEYHDENVKKIEARKEERKENVKKWIKANYRKKSDETVETYYKRFCSKFESTDEEYIERITISRSLFADLDLWYSDKYLSETRFYYNLAYSKKTTETVEEYYSRLVTKESYESEENWAKRIYVLHLVFPTLSLWYDDKYYESYTSTFFHTYYKKVESESSEVYLKKVFTKCSGESEENFWRRVRLVQKTFPNYQCWYGRENLQKLELCQYVREATSFEQLKVKIEEKTSESIELRKIKLECLQTFFKTASECTCEEDDDYEDDDD